MEALEQPVVSIVICNYNYEKFLEDALVSATSQTYPHVEVIVIDDGSTDRSREILLRWQDRVKVVLQENGGQCSAYNKGFVSCSGDIVIFLDSDDLLDVDAVSAVVPHFTDRVAKVHYRMRVIDNSGVRLGAQIPAVLGTGAVGESLRKSGFLYPSAPGSGNAYSRKALEKLFPLPVHAADRHGADFYTVYGSCLYGEVRAVERPLASYRAHVAAKRDSRALSFGNTAPGNPVTKFDCRQRNFRNWIGERSGGEVVLPPQFLDFSIEKIRFASAVMAETAYLGGLGRGCTLLRRILAAICLNPFFSSVRKGGLLVWAMAVLVAPRSVGLRLAQYVCNPANRGAGAPS